LNPFPNGLSVLEAIAVISTFGLFVVWFCYWHFGYGRFQETDMKHDCWPSEAKGVSDDSVLTTKAQVTCDKIPGSVSTGNGELHVLARVFGHMSSLAFALTMLPAAKASVLMRGVGMTYEAVIHWHRGLGAVAYIMVTIHMLLWWLKFILDGTFVRNLLSIDTDKWLWITPTWNHYENWSVIMAQVSWFLFTFSIVIAFRLRRKMYRLFYISHHLAVFFFFIGVMHAWSFWYFAIPGLGLWWIDRMVRLVSASEYAEITSFRPIRGTDVTEVEVRAPGLASRWMPAQFALLNVADVSKNEWHPFTVNVTADKVLFLCKTEANWTKKLNSTAREMSSSSSASASVPSALVVGPYGGIHPSQYSKPPVFLAAGGIGITPVIAVFQEALRRQVKGVTLLWSIRSVEYLEIPFIRSVLERAGHPNHISDSVKVIVHVTQASGELPASPSSNISYNKGRPNIEEIMRQAASLPIGKLEDGFAFACGPTVLQETVLKTARELGFGQSHIEVFAF
jgi:predicted ferric reductase